MKVIAYVFGGLFVTALVVTIVINVIGIIKDVKERKNKQNDTKGE